MGKGRSKHEDVRKYLESEYGESKPRTLKSVYPSWWDKEYKKERKLSCDYVNNSNKCNALVDVIGNESWMSSLGKVIAYLNEVSAKPGNQEVWLIFYSKSHWTQEKEWDENNYTKYLRAWYKLLLEMSRKVIKKKLINRLKFFDYDEDEDRRLIPIELSNRKDKR